MRSSVCQPALIKVNIDNSIYNVSIVGTLNKKLITHCLIEFIQFVIIKLFNQMIISKGYPKVFQKVIRFIGDIFSTGTIMTTAIVINCKELVLLKKNFVMSSSNRRMCRMLITVIRAPNIYSSPLTKSRKNRYFNLLSIKENVIDTVIYRKLNLIKILIHNHLYLKQNNPYVSVNAILFWRAHDCS